MSSDTQAKITITADDQATSVVQRAAQAFGQLDQATTKAGEGMKGFNANAALSVAAGFGIEQIGVKFL